MKVGFNSDLFMRRPMTGIANYCFEMLRAQLALDGTVDYLGFNGLSLGRVDTAYLSKVAHDHLKSPADIDAPSQVRARAGQGLEWMARTASRFSAARIVYRSLRKRSFGRSLARVADELDLFHAFNFLPHAAITVQTLPVVYDLSFVRFPESHPKERLQALKSLPQVIARAPMIQTISQFSKREIVSVYGCPDQRIFVAPPAASAVFRPLGDAITGPDIAAFDLTIGQYFLAVGTLEPRKNMKTLIAAYAQLSSAEQARCSLVIVGGKGWGQLELPAQTERLEQSGALRFVGGVSDASLRSLYEGARMLLFPSIYEGFGMPVVEALACGTAVAHSPGTSMDEIAGDLAVRVAATDVQAWTDLMRATIAQSREGHDVIGRARIAQAATFDWSRSAATVLDAYRTLAGQTPYVMA